MKKLIFYTVTKQEIERLKFGRVREMIRGLETGGAANHKSLVILFDGYNDVVEELYMIPEVRKWTKEFLDRFPHVFYFLENKISESYTILLMHVAKVNWVMHKGEMPKPISEYSHEEMMKGLPRHHALINMDARMLKRIYTKTMAYGESVGDQEGSTAVCMDIETMFSPR